MTRKKRSNERPFDGWQHDLVRKLIGSGYSLAKLTFLTSTYVTKESMERYQVSSS
jgi:hypothetical protein